MGLKSSQEYSPIKLMPPTAPQAGGSRVRFSMNLLEYSLMESFRPHYGLGVDSASNRNEYQWYLLEGRGERRGKEESAQDWQTYRLQVSIVYKFCQFETTTVLRVCPGL